MPKTKALKRNKYSKKTRKNINYCEKGLTDEVIRMRGLINFVKERNKRLAQKVVQKVVQKPNQKPSKKSLGRTNDH
jgi:ribulose bisphosphate carboxylase small subunit